MGSNASSERRPDADQNEEDGNVWEDVWERDINNNLTGRRIPRTLQELRWSLDDLSDDEEPNPFIKRPKLCECCTRWSHFICAVCRKSFVRRKTPTKNRGGALKKPPTDCVPLEYPECPFCHSFSTMVDKDYEN
ncbi:hypothetical protein KR074_001254 [Drosophila pseudoananassae]|nr:hypothetical protein KR074_001254 [Drosophila pseudoananassae]